MRGAQGPLTWRNVNIPEGGGITGMAALAQSGINSGFDAFNRVIQQRQQVEDDNWKQVGINNTNAFMDRIASVKTPEEMAALQASGELDRMRQAAGAQFDAKLAREAEDGRLAVLQDRLVKANAYTDSVEERTYRDDVARLKTEGLADPLGGFISVQDAAIPDRFKTEILKTINDQSRQNLLDDQKIKNDAASREAHIAQAEQAKANARLLDITAANGGLTPAQKLAQEKEDAKAKQEQADNARRVLMSENYMSNGTFAHEKAGKDVFSDALTSAGVPKESWGSYWRTYEKLAAKGLEYTVTNQEGKDKKITLPISADLMVLALNKAKDTKSWGMGDSAAENMETQLKNIMQDASTDPQVFNSYLNGLAAYHKGKLPEEFKNIQRTVNIPKPTLTLDKTTDADVKRFIENNPRFKEIAAAATEADDPGLRRLLRQ